MNNNVPITPQPSNYDSHYDNKLYANYLDCTLLWLKEKNKRDEHHESPRTNILGSFDGTITAWGWPYIVKKYMED
jgi:hypothetical protein